MSDATKNRKALWTMIKSIRFGMLTHRHPGGLLHSHPLMTQNQSLDEAAVLYFFIPTKSEMATRLREDASVNLSYVSPDNDSYVSIAGMARITHDPERTRQLWSPAAEVWFPGGPSDPHLVLLEVDIANAQCWDAGKRHMTPLIKKPEEESSHAANPKPLDDVRKALAR